MFRSYWDLKLQTVNSLQTIYINISMTNLLLLGLLSIYVNFWWPQSRQHIFFIEFYKYFNDSDFWFEKLNVVIIGWRVGTDHSRFHKSTQIFKPTLKWTCYEIFDTHKIYSSTSPPSLIDIIFIKKS